jgi:SPP1 family predicted phage head-tail adaptor
MRAGSLKHRVSLQRRAEGVDALGQPLDEWEQVAEVWADIADVSGRELAAANQVPANPRVVDVRIRNRGDLTPYMRAQELCHGRKLLNVTAVLREYAGNAPGLRLECEELDIENADES